MTEYIPDTVELAVSEELSGSFAPSPLRLSGMSKVNVFVGPNNSGKSRLMRALMAPGNGWRCGEFGPRFAGVRAAADRFVEERAGLSMQECVEALKTFAPPHMDDFAAAAVSVLALERLLGQRECLFFSSRRTASVDLRMGSAYRPAHDFGNGLVHLLAKAANAIADHASRGSSNHSASCYSSARMRSSRPPEVYGTSDIVEVAREASGVLGRAREHARVYVPILRGMRLLEDANVDLYRHATERDYEIPSWVKVFSGQAFHPTLRGMLLGKRDERLAVSEYEAWLSREFFRGQGVTLVPGEDGKVSLTVEGAGGTEEFQEHTVEHWGDGFQAIVAATFAPFSRQRFAGEAAGRGEPAVLLQFFIEEPEIHLHPGLQRVLLRAYRSLPGVQVFMTTHSTHLVDLVAGGEDTSVFAVKKGGLKVRSTVALQSRETMRVVVEELGARASSLVFVNATLWVEGVTERLFFGQALELFQDMEGQEPRVHLDQHYSIVEYGGGNRTHFDFGQGAADPSEEGRVVLSDVCATAFVIADRDGYVEDPQHPGSWLKWEKDPSGAYAKASALTQKGELPKKLDGLIELRDGLAGRFLWLEVRELENLHSWECVRAFVSHKEGQPGLGAQLAPPSDWAHKYLGDAIVEAAEAAGVTLSKQYAAKSGTLTTSMKKELAAFALEFYRAGGAQSMSVAMADALRSMLGFVREQNGLADPRA